MTTQQISPRTPEQIVDAVRDHYGAIARGHRGCGCGAQAATSETGRLGYDAQELAAAGPAAEMSLGCGAPVAELALQPGEVVLDLGSGGGLDAFVAAREVGPGGRVIGVDMTPDMIARARRNAQALGLGQVEFRQGRLEQLPVDDASVDAVTSNCVINLVPDKARVFAEVARVLRPGGRLVISDIVLERPLPAAVDQDLLALVGCVAGAAPREDYFAWLKAAGLDEIDVLRDVDALDLVGEIPAWAEMALRARGLTLDELRGSVRSITLRAVRQA